jgi:Zn-dependent M28 family amino/carboxypeptidase
LNGTLRILVYTIALCVPARIAAAADFNGQQALQYAAQIVAFGQRTPGSPGHHKAEEFILKHLKQDNAQIDSDSFTATTPKGPLPMRNIIAKFGTGNDHILLVTGHYDTKFLHNFVGANDGGSSTALLLALADSLARTPPKTPVWLVFFDGEEAVREWTDTDSTYGSRHLAQKFQNERLIPKIRALLLVDMIGDRDLDIARDENSTPWLIDFVSSAAQQVGDSDYFFKQSMAISDDHEPFTKIGVPSIDLIDFTFGPNNTNRWWHTPQDTLDKLSAHSLQVVGDVVLKTLQLLQQQ